MPRIRLNCFSRKAAASDPPPARPVFDLPSRPRAESSKPNLQPKAVEISRLPINLCRSPLKPSQNAMSNAVRPGVDGGNAPRRSYIEISDDEDDEDLIDLQECQVSARQTPALQHSNTSPPAPMRNGPQPKATPGPPEQVQADAEFDAFVIEDGDELDVNDPVLAQYMMEGFNREHNEEAVRSAQPAHQIPPELPDREQPLPMVDPRIYSIDQVMLVFPEICRDYVSLLYATVTQSSDFLIDYILDKIDKGTPYPKARDTQNKMKRKRQLDEDEEAARKYGSADRVIPEGAGGLRPYIRGILSREFPETPMNFIDSALNQSGYRVFSTYRVLDEAHQTFDVNPRQIPYNKIKHQRKMEDEYKDANLEGTIQRMTRNGYQNQEVEVLRELQAARRFRKKAEAKRQAAYLAKVEEEKNVQRAQADGTMGECGCCFGDYPMNRMVHCDNEAIHFFCRACAKQNADTEIGNSKYELHCMSMDGCSGGFSLDQRNQFLDKSTIIALERNEQEAVLRMAGIENLASCPFCPFAAEYLPIEIDREFRCQAPDCEKTSCRLCKLESHIPKSCEEHAKDLGLSVRRQIEEAMSAALIRKCNRCGTPFVKEEGCNKMTCTRNGCMNVQCYVCSKSCQYDHFNDTRRGGKNGNCPLFESVEDRHDNEVKKAEKEALDRIRAEYPEYAEEDLRVKMSENVKKDDERRKANDPRNRNLAAGVGVPDIFGGPPAIFYGFGPRPGLPAAAPAFPAAVPRMPPAAPLPLGPVNPRRFRPVPNYAQDIFADINFDDDLEDEMFFRLWDDFPGLGLELPGQIQGQAIRQPPPAPPLHPVGRQCDVLPHRVPEAAVGQPVLAANSQNIFGAVPLVLAQQNVQPQEYGWNAVPPRGGAQAFPYTPRRASRAANEPLQPPMVFDNHEADIAGQRQRAQELRNSIANLQQIADAVPPPQPGNQAAYMALHQQRRQQPQRLLANLDLPLAMQPNAGVNAQQGGAVTGLRGRWQNHAGRGGAINPANGQA